MLALRTLSVIRTAARTQAPIARYLSTFPSDRRYTKSHEWAKLEGDVATVGITEHAQNALGDIVFVELPDVGAEAIAGERAATVESVKTAADIYSPMAGEVVEVNEKLTDAPELINSSAHDDGWIFRVKVSDTGAHAGLLDEGAYSKVCEEE